MQDRTQLLDRLEAAYAANNIPFDGFPVNGPDEETLEALCEHWEGRAADVANPPEPSILELQSNRAIIKRLQRLSGFRRDGRSAVNASSVQYHGPGASFDA